MNKSKQLKQEEQWLKQSINQTIDPQERDYLTDRLRFVINERQRQNRRTIILIIIIILGLIISGIFTIGKINENRNEKSKHIVNSRTDDWGVCNDPFCSDVHIAKPIIYLYPEKEMKVTIKLGNPEKLTCTYPKYDEDGWNVIAKPDGKLIDTETGRNLYSLYWEGTGLTDCDFSEGFVVKGEDSIKFLEEKLKILGLNEYEAEEFIVYWLPNLEANKYNFISFMDIEKINEEMPLEVSGNPDSVIRIMMQFKELNKPIKVKEQKLITPERTGFTVVEWGGTELK